MKIDYELGYEMSQLVEAVFFCGAKMTVSHDNKGSMPIMIEYRDQTFVGQLSSVRQICVWLEAQRYLFETKQP